MYRLTVREYLLRDHLCRTTIPCEPAVPPAPPPMHREFRKVSVAWIYNYISSVKAIVIMILTAKMD